MTPEEDRATATGNVHRKISEVLLFFYSSRQTNGETDRQTQYFALLPGAK